ncbi:MAG: hypothetical protein ABJF05_12790 [Paracoccaceae bacterium]
MRRNLKPLVEMIHESQCLIRRRGQVRAIGDYWFAGLMHAPRHYWLVRSVRMISELKFIRDFVMGCFVRLGEELDGRRAGQGAFAMHLVDFALNDDMCAIL